MPRLPALRRPTLPALGIEPRHLRRCAVAVAATATTGLAKIVSHPDRALPALAPESKHFANARWIIPDFQAARRFLPQNYGSCAPESESIWSESVWAMNAGLKDVGNFFQITPSTSSAAGVFADIDNKFEAILAKLEQSQMQQRQMHLQVMQAIQGVAMGAPTRHPDQRRSDPSRVMRRQSRTQGDFPGPVTSLSLSSGKEKSSESQFDKPATSFSYHTLGSLDEDMPILPISRSQIGAQAPHADELPGMIRDETHLVVPRPNRGSRMQTMSQESQEGLLADYPIILYLLVLVPTLAQLVTMLVLATTGMNRTATYSFNLVCNSLYACLAVASVFLLGKALRSSDFHLATSRLHLFVADFKLRWSEVSGQEWRKYALAWCIMVVFAMVSQILQAWIVESDSSVEEASAKVVKHVIEALSVVSFATSSAVVILAAYLQSHLLLGLDKSLDCWCCQVVNSMDFAPAVQSWNAMQALLKCISRELASSFLSLQILSSLGFVYFLATSVTWDPHILQTVVESLASLPLVWLFLLGMRVCMHGADLTEKCRAIPAFVNQIPTNLDVDLDRQYLVTFIADSSAGFAVKDVKLTQEPRSSWFVFDPLLSWFYKGFKARPPEKIGAMFLFHRLLNLTTMMYNEKDQLTVCDFLVPREQRERQLQRSRELATGAPAQQSPLVRTEESPAPQPLPASSERSREQLTTEEGSEITDSESGAEQS
eukprot:s267_g5.t1